MRLDAGKMYALLADSLWDYKILGIPVPLIAVGIWIALRHNKKEPSAAPTVEELPSTPAPNSRVLDFLRGLACVWARVAQVDGELRPVERDRIIGLINSFCDESDEIRDEVDDADEFVDVYADADDEESIEACLNFARSNHALRLYVIESCWAVAVADHDVTALERAVIGSVASTLGLSEEDAAALAYPFIRPDEDDLRIQDARDVLGVSREAAGTDIKKAFHRLAARYHPDKHTQAAEALRELAERRFQEISAAYAVLSRSQSQWFGLDPERHAVEARPSMIVRCGFCGQMCRLPARDDRLGNARCGACYRFLLYEEESIYALLDDTE